MKVNFFSVILILLITTFIISLVNFSTDFASLNDGAPMFGEDFIITSQANYAHLDRRFVITVALLLSVSSFFRDRKLWLYFSMLSLFCVQLVYFHWLFGTYQGVVNAENLGYDKIDHLLFLGQAKFNDILVWFFAAILLPLIVFHQIKLSKSAIS